MHWNLRDYEGLYQYSVYYCKYFVSCKYSLCLLFNLIRLYWVTHNAKEMWILTGMWEWLDQAQYSLLGQNSKTKRLSSVPYCSAWARALERFFPAFCPSSECIGQSSNIKHTQRREYFQLLEGLSFKASSCF